MISWLRKRWASRNGYTAMAGKEPFNTLLPSSNNPAKNRLLIGTATTGLCRMEWAFARFGAVMPCNWGSASFMAHIPTCAPLGYAVADAQNVIVAKAIEINAQWLFLIEQDNVLPPNAFVILNEYIRSEDVPIVSGLYFTKSVPGEPMVYRGRGTSYYDQWKLGDKVWCDGVPTGCLLVHMSILRAMWAESEEYLAGGKTLARKVFTIPEVAWADPGKGWQTHSGTSDLEWCSRVIMGGFFEKASWTEYVGKKWPLLVDTRILTPHIREDGVAFPSEVELDYWRQEPRERKEDRKRERQKQQ